MPLKIQGSVAIDAPREEVYKLLLDAAWMKQVIGKIPGITVESLEQVSETEYSGVLTLGVATVKGTYNGKITILDRQPVELIKMRAEAKGGGNWTSGDATLTLTEQAPVTLLSYNGQGNINGPLASVGQRLVDVVGRQIIDQGAKAFADEIARAHREKAEAAAAAETPAGTTTAAAPPAPTPARALFAWVLPAALAAIVIIALLAYYLMSR
ncbi:MAG: carbon monoxide dehydrogenase subunit G [Anaerolineae bacterium]